VSFKIGSEYFLEVAVGVFVIQRGCSLLRILQRMGSGKGWGRKVKG
jgi:hypothetical protein